MDLNEFDISETFDLVIKAVDGTPTDVVFTVCSDLSYEYDKAMAEIVLMGEADNKPEILLSKIVKGVKGLTVDGNPFDFSEANVLEVLKTKRLIMKQVDEAVYTRSNFTKG